MADEDLRSAFDAIEAQWNTAEEYVKKVERLRRGLVVGASINEFRYAGRRMVEAYSLIKAAENDPNKRGEALGLLREVKHFCLRAQHDAMDAAVTYIDQALAKFEEEFGADLLHEKFPHYLAMKEALREVSEVMSASRLNRDARDELYLKIREDLVPTLIDHHNSLETSGVVLIAAYTRRVKGEKREEARFLLTISVGAVAAIAAVAALFPIIEPMMVKPATPVAAASTPSAGTNLAAPAPHP